MEKQNESSKVKLSDFRLGGLFRKMDEIKRRIASGALDYDETMEALQFVIENKGFIMAKVARGVAELKDLPYMVSLEAQPKQLSGYIVSYHNGGGIFNFLSQGIDLFAPPSGMENGFKVKNTLDRPLNGNMLDFLLSHQDLIPQACRGKYTCFFGTIYRHIRDDEPYIRAMFYCDDRYQDMLIHLDSDFGEDMPILVIKDEGERKEVNHGS